LPAAVAVVRSMAAVAVLVDFDLRLQPQAAADLLKAHFLFQFRQITHAPLVLAAQAQEASAFADLLVVTQPSLQSLQLAAVAADLA
jgi:hypothetical protein